MALSAEPTNLDPLFALDAASQRIDNLLYDALVDIDNDLKIVPHLAESWINPSDTIYRFTLRKDAQFHDGTPVYASAITQTLERILDPAIGSPYLASFKNIKKISLINEFTFEIHLKIPQASFLTDLTLVKALPSSPEKRNTFIGSGPYQFISKNTQEIILQRNPNHFKFKPSLEKIVFKIIKDDNTRLLKLKKNEIDLIQNALNADAVLQSQQDPRLSLTKSAGLTYVYLGCNLKHPILKQKEIRKAIAFAIHKSEIIEHLLQNLATPAHGILSPLNWYAEENLPPYNYNPETAKKLLAQAHVSLPLKIEYKTSTDVESVNIARLIASQLKPIGIEIEIRSQEWGAFFKDIQSGNFQLFSSRWVGVTDPDIYYDAFHSSNFSPGKNRVFYSNPKLDLLLEEGKREIQPIRRKKIFSKIQKIIAEDLPYVSLWHLSNVAIYSNKLRGFYFHPQGSFVPFTAISKVDEAH